MRKTQKQEIMEMIKTLHEAHDEVEKYIGKKDNAIAQDILSQCQECAISIGTVIENLEGEGFVTITYIEAYCEILFKIYEELNGIYVDAGKAHKNLKKQLINIENSVKNDIPLHKEVVFFPYKASMWDSLESVYLAAKEDANCTAYCVPIPYYDRNSDGSLGQMHYEGREYPKNIEVIDWQTYNFEERKPDAIYIHNPYDECNFVTCVHPRFFSANLKKYTEKLVYIPYFVMDEIEPTDQARIDGMKHFCFLPGVVNADKVIVQSEKMKRIYVNEYLKAAQANNFQGDHVDRKKLEEKFLGLGSPKFDKVQNTKKEDLEIPDEWLKIIEKPDGSWKKIIFYNTSIAALLEHNEKMLEKMKYVFDVFKENKDEVALLWRPHPLIKTTIESMRPQLWIEYDKLVKQYKEEGWGIYDDSTELDRAVVVSDAYYGDPSSVVQVYQKTEKPIGIQIIQEKKVSTKIAFLDLMFIGDEVWFSAANRNGMFKYNNTLKEFVCVGIFPNERNYADFLHSEIKKYGSKLIFIPFQAKNICIYDLETGLFENVELPRINRGQEYSRFYTAIQEENIIYMIPCRYGGLVKFNIENKEIQIVEMPLEDKEEHVPIAMKAGCKVEECIYIGSFTQGIIEEFNLLTKTKTRYYIDFCEKGISNLAYHNGCFWIANNEGELISWNKGEKKIERIKVCNQGLAPHAIFEILPKENYIYIASSIEKRVFRYDILNKKLDVVYEEENSKEKEFADSWTDFCALTITPKDNVGFFDTIRSQYIVIDEKNKKKDTIEYEYYKAKKYYSELQKTTNGENIWERVNNEREFIYYVCNS